MIRRKIQRTGIATFTVSLPKAWVQRNGVLAGNSVFINEERDQSLLLSLEKNTEEIKENTINLDKFDTQEEFVRKFISHYINGSSKITFTCTKGVSKEYRKRIFDQVGKTIGFEIIEESRDQIVLQDFFSSTSFSLNNVIKRAFSLSKLMIEECLKLLNKEIDLLDNVMMWEEEVNKIYLLARRQINFALHNSTIMNKLSLDVNDCQDFIILIGAIEKIADSFVRVAKNCLKVTQLNKEVYELTEAKFTTILDTYELALSSYLKKDFSLSNQVINKCEEISDAVINLEKYKLNVEDKIILYLILSKLKSKANLINEIAELGLDRS